MPDEASAGAVQKFFSFLADKFGAPWMGPFLSFVLLLVTSVSVICAFISYCHQRQRQKKDAACELARYYAHNIILEASLIIDVFKFSGLDNEVHSLFPYDKISDLNYTEMEKLLNEAGKDFDAVDKMMTREIDPHAIFKAKLRNAASIEDRRLLIDEYTIGDPDPSDPDSTGELIHIDFLNKEFERAITYLLNDLEWFAMTCQYGLADEEMLYQSLHQTYISQVWLLYFYICKSNLSNEDKFYTNLIWLFNLWKDRLKKIQLDANMTRAEYQAEIDEAERRKAAAQEQVNRDPAKIFKGKPLK